MSEDLKKKKLFIA